VSAREMSKEEIIEISEQLAITNFEVRNWNFWSRTWVDGIRWAGVVDLATVSDEPKLQEAIVSMGSKNRPKPWVLWQEHEGEPHFADELCIGETFVAEFERTGDPAVIADTQARIDAAATAILSEEMAETFANREQREFKTSYLWYWCDSLIMAPPAFARLSAATGNPKYLEAMHLEWRRTSESLYDEEEHLYYRDANFVPGEETVEKSFKNRPTQTANGEKVFWSRGNGWVMGAFARTIPYIPVDDPEREWYIDQFKEMSAKIASLQRPDGTWSPSLLDYEDFPYSEMSGTSLYCFALAWGINEGILPKDEYLPVVEKAWAAMLQSFNDKGLIGYVQGVGDQPGKVFSQMNNSGYADGAFMMAAAQLVELAPINVPEIPDLVAEGEWPGWHKNSKK
ncbi:MAG: glycoside hydrolase family 88/105 protein, partial [Puniceicoccales bacterium]